MSPDPKANNLEKSQRKKKQICSILFIIFFGLDFET